MVGGAAPNHYIRIPDDDEESGDKLKAILEEFKDKTKKKASEIKLATASYQWTKDGISPFVQVSARPQTNNETSDFNKDVAKAMVKAESVLRKDGYQVSFACCANDGVSCDSKFVHETLGDFLKGNISYSAHTDTNHNVKNSRYQLVVGFNGV